MKQETKVRGGRLLVALTSLGAIQPTVRAQNAEDGSAKIEEVMVTAQRRSERLEDVPMSVTALSPDALQQAGVTNSFELQRATPGLVMSFYSNNLQPAIRGVSATGASIGDNPSVAMYLDGAYQAQQVSGLMDCRTSSRSKC